MDPITTAFLAALATGIGAGAPQVAEQAIIDGYNALKFAIQKKFGQESAIVEAVEKLEVKPKSTGRQTTLHEEIIDSGADQDPELLNAATALLAIIKELPEGQTIVKQVVTGNRNIFSGSGDVNVTR
jgi:hypothetical protein